MRGIDLEYANELNLEKIAIFPPSIYDNTNKTL